MKIIKSFRDATNGIFHSISMERNLKIQVVSMICVIVLGLIVGLCQFEWIVCITLFGLVISAEMFNTALEETLDYINEDYCDEIRFIKDASAGAVLVIAIASAVIGLIIFIPKFI